MVLAYIDTNVFLDFYQSSTDRLAVFEDILARAKNVLLTQQTVDEFRRNRVARLTQLADAVKKGPHGQIHTTAVVQALPGFEGWVKARDATRAAALEIANELTSWVLDEQSDPVLVAFERLVAGAQSIATAADLVAKARTRKLLGSPPTSPGKHTVGDELNWECLLSWTGSDVVIVTRDRTYLDNQALHLKAVVLAGSKLVALRRGDEIAIDQVLKGHGLSVLLPSIKTIIEVVGWSWDMGVDGLRNEADFKRLVTEIEAVDPGSFAFRYPTDKTGGAILPARFEFSVGAFASRLDPLLESLAGAVFGIEAHWESAVEAAYVARQDAGDET